MSLLPVPVDQSDDTMSEVVDHVANSFQSYLALNPNQKRILCAILDDFQSGVFRSDTEIASDLGVCRRTVYNTKLKPHFLQAIRDIMPEITSAKLPEVVSNAVKLSKKSVAAIEFVSRFSGAYVPKSQQLNVQARIDTRSANMSPDEIIDQFLGRLLGLGWSPERIRDRAQQIQDRL